MHFELKFYIFMLDSHKFQNDFFFFFFFENEMLVEIYSSTRKVRQNKSANDQWNNLHLDK